MKIEGVTPSFKIPFPSPSFIQLRPALVTLLCLEILNHGPASPTLQIQVSSMVSTYINDCRPFEQQVRYDQKSSEQNTGVRLIAASTPIPHQAGSLTPRLH